MGDANTSHWYASNQPFLLSPNIWHAINLFNIKLLWDVSLCVLTHGYVPLSGWQCRISVHFGTVALCILCTLMEEATFSSETLVPCCQVTLRRIQGRHHVHSYCCQNLKSHTLARNHFRPCGPPATMTWRVLSLRVEETTSRYEG
jgi:hypothetical protein